MQELRTAFARIKSLFDERESGRGGLVCKQGFYSHCSVLKLQKASWTNDRMDQVRNETGIFFSIWMDKNAVRESRTSYNIHALKLRQLKGYAITSRAFADDFRNGFASMRDDWPNVSVDFGPLTLMQGWITADPNTFEEDVLLLMKRFKRVCPLIDRLLKSRRIVSSAPTPAASR